MWVACSKMPAVSSCKTWAIDSTIWVQHRRERQACAIVPPARSALAKSSVMDTYGLLFLNKRIRLHEMLIGWNVAPLRGDSLATFVQRSLAHPPQSGRMLLASFMSLKQPPCIFADSAMSEPSRPTAAQSRRLLAKGVIMLAAQKASQPPRMVWSTHLLHPRPHSTIYVCVREAR